MYFLVTGLLASLVGSTIISLAFFDTRYQVYSWFMFGLSLATVRLVRREQAELATGEATLTSRREAA